MNTFLKTYKLALTPLSPIHIGCGEDFEPTNYVIDDGVLYGFDPSRALLDDSQRKELSQLGMGADLQGIQIFFRNHKGPFKAAADVLIPVAAGLAQEYEQKLGLIVQREAARKNIVNRLTIERAVTTGIARIPFIPGSSLKGAIRTSHLNSVNRGEPIQYGENDRKHGSTKLEKRLYQEIDFDMSPMRLVKVGDMMPRHDLHRSITYAVMRRKRFVRDATTGDEKQTQDNLATRKEVIVHGQYRSLVGELSINSLDDLPESDNTPRRSLRPSDIAALVGPANDFHLPKLLEEIRLLASRCFSSERWLTSVSALLSGELGSKLNEGNAFLVRLGRYGGAETKTLDGVRAIHIPQAKHDDDKYVSTAHCIWLTANNPRARSDMLPFGWAVVEIDPQDDASQLKEWCTAESKGRPDMIQLRRQFDAERLEAQKQKARMVAEAVAREDRRQAELHAQKQKALALASMTAQGRSIESLRQRCEDWFKHLPPNGNYKKQEANVRKAGLYQEAEHLVKQSLTGSDWTGDEKLRLAEMLDEWLPKVIAPWGKEERKKLKMPALRGNGQ